MNKELEEAIKRIKILINDDCDCEECMKNKEAYKTVLQAVENSIPKSVVEEKIEYVKEEGYWEFTTDRDADKCVDILQELLQ